MASIQIMSPMPLVEQTKALSSFLSQHNHVIPGETALHAIVYSLELSSTADAKAAVQQLRAELKVHGVVLAQSSGYEAIARLCGFNNWMQASVHFSSQGQAFAREGFTMRLVSSAGDAGPFQAYESLPKLANEVIKLANELLGQQYCPAFCTLLHGRKGLRVEFELADKLGFSFDVLTYRTEGEKVHFVEIDGEAVRGFASRLERAIEMGHPGAIVSGTVLSTTLPHWYYPRYTLKSLRQKARDIVVDNEMQLFVMLEGVGVEDGTQLEPANSTIYGDSDDIRIVPAWDSPEDSSSKIHALTASQFSSLVQRFLRFKRVLRQPFREVMLLLTTGAVDADGYFPLDKARLVQGRETVGLSLEQLAGVVGISVPDLVRIEKYGHAHESVIDKLAKAIGLGTGNALLDEDGEEGTGFRLESADSLVLALSDTHAYRCIISEHFQGDEKEAVEAIAQNIQEYGDLVQISEGVFDEVFKSDVNMEALKGSLQECLDELSLLGGAIVVSRSLRFTGWNEQGSGQKSIPMHSLTMFFEKLDKLRAPGSGSASASVAEGGRHV